MVTNQEFTEIILKNKTLYFSEEVLTDPENYPLVLSMTSAGIRWFTIDFEKYPVKDLQDALKDKFNISSYTTWEDSLVYLKNVVSFFYYEGEKLHYDTSQLFKNQLSTSILRDFIGSDTNFLFTYLSKTNNNEIDYIFINGLVLISFEANFPINLIILLFKKVFDLQQDVFYIEWHNTIFKLAVNHPAKGKEIIQHLKVDLEPHYEELIGQIIGGVCSSSLIENIEFFKDLYQKDKFQGWILWGMTRIEKVLSKEDLIKMLDLAETNSLEIGVLNNLMRFYIITWGYNSVNRKVSLRCFEGIKQLLNQESPYVLHSFLNNITYNSKLPEEDVCELLKMFLRNPNHPVEVFSANGSNIHRFDWCVKENIRTPKYFFEILFSFVNDTSHIFSIDVFNQSLPIILKTYPVESMRFILECLTDYSGRIRHLGHTLLEKQLKIQPDIRFGDELQSLNFEKKTILVLSIAIPQTLEFPKLFRLITPFLEMGEEAVQQLIIRVLFKNVLQKGGLTNIIKEELSDSEEKSELLTILNRMDEYNQEIYIKKTDLKEFKPEHSQQKIFTLFNKNFNEFYSQNFQKIWKENSFMKIFGDNTIVLLKGGGYKSEFNSEYSYLSNFQQSVSIPHSAFLDSEQESFDTYVYFNETWKTFNNLQKWLRKF